MLFLSLFLYLIHALKGPFFVSIIERWMLLLLRLLEEVGEAEAAFPIIFLPKENIKVFVRFHSWCSRF